MTWRFSFTLGSIAPDSELWMCLSFVGAARRRQLTVRRETAVHPIQGRNRISPVSRLGTIVAFAIGLVLVGQPAMAHALEE